jgi:hypothetical protein
LSFGESKKIMRSFVPVSFQTVSLPSLQVVLGCILVLGMYVRHTSFFLPLQVFYYLDSISFLKTAEKSLNFLFAIR